MKKDKCKCNKDARLWYCNGTELSNVKSSWGEWYCWDCFSHFEEEQSVREQAQPIQED